MLIKSGNQSSDLSLWLFSSVMSLDGQMVVLRQDWCTGLAGTAFLLPLSSTCYIAQQWLEVGIALETLDE